MTFEEVFKICKPYTMTCINRMRALYNAIYYIEEEKIPGDLVETGVWKGGNLMLMGLVLKSLGSARRVYGFDTFTGMTELGENDVRLEDGGVPDFSKRNNLYVPKYKVEKNVKLSGYPYIKLVRGRVEETIPSAAPEQVALLRIDTDLYSPTIASLRLLNRMPHGAVIIDDDYYKFKGAKMAIDEKLPTHMFNQIENSNAIIAYR